MLAPQCQPYHVGLIILVVVVVVVARTTVLVRATIVQNIKVKMTQITIMR